MSGLPKGWANASLDELGATHSAGVWGADLDADGTLARVKIVRNGDISAGGAIRWEALPERALTVRDVEKAALHPGDVLVTTSGEVGKTAIWPELPDSSPPRFGASNFVRRIRGTLRSVGPWIHCYLRTTEANQLFKKYARGVAIQNLSAQFWSELRVPVAPRNEQARIVSAIESYFTRLDDAVASLERVQRNLKRYRASVLKAAVEGRLVPTEAELARAEGRNYEPASVLIDRTEAPPRPNRWNSRSMDVVPGHAALAIGNPKTPLPEGWEWSPLVNIARMESGHTPSREHPEWWDGDVPWIGIADARAHHGGRILKTLQHTNADGLANSAARLLPAGTVCVSRTASVGYVVVTGRPMATSQDFVNWVPTEAVTSAWLRLVFCASREALIRFGKGSVHKTIYFPEWLSVHIAVPPALEQARIVAEADRLLSVADAAEATLAAGVGRCARLRQAILKWAFEGRLVDQDPTDEPASVLLDRIRAERASATDKPPRRARSARAAKKQGS